MKIIDDRATVWIPRVINDGVRLQYIIWIYGRPGLYPFRAGERER